MASPDRQHKNLIGPAGNVTVAFITNIRKHIPAYPVADLSLPEHLSFCSTGHVADTANGNPVKVAFINVERIDSKGSSWFGEKNVPYYYSTHPYKAGSVPKPVLQGVYTESGDKAFALAAYESASLAERLTGVFRTHISSVCNNTDNYYTAGKNAHGWCFFWEFIEKPKDPEAASFKKLFASKPASKGPDSSSSSSTLSLSSAAAGSGAS